MRAIFVRCCAVALATGCATSQPTAPTVPPMATVPPTPKVVPPRSDCPEGCHMLRNQHGRACVPKNVGDIRDECRPQLCGDYRVWDCHVTMVPDPAAPNTQVCFLPARDAQGNLVVERRRPAIVVHKPRKVPLTGPPGEVLSLSLPAGPFQRSYYYYRRGQDGIQYICPFKGRKRCEEEGVPKDQECADYSQCLEVCLDAGGNVIW